MKFYYFLNKTALFIAAEKGNADIVKLLLKHPKIDINMISILTIQIFIKFLL